MAITTVGCSIAAHELVFLHYYGTRAAEKLTTNVRAAIAQPGKGPLPR